MKRFVLTGAPGSGKTSVLRVLAATGYPVVDEAATDVMAARLAAEDAEPWAGPIFIERIALLQRRRREEPVGPGASAQVHDRSAVCTLALAHHLGHPVPPVLEAEIARITEAGNFDRRVFFVRPLGFLQPTQVRRISYEESLAFEHLHETAYQRLGFEIVDVPAGPVAERAAAIDAYIRSWAMTGHRAAGRDGVGRKRRRTGAPSALREHAGMRWPMARRATTVFVTIAAADTVLAGMGRDRPRWLTKPLLMPALMASSDRSSRRALAFGAAGDVALLGSGDAAFTAGLVSFLAGHLAWIAALRQRSGGGRLRSRPALALPYLAAFGALNAYLWPRTGKDRIPVLGYSTALLAMALTALDTGSPRAAAGGALFLVSDSLLALEKFAGIRWPAHEGVLMATYTSAQALLALPRDPEAASRRSTSGSGTDSRTTRSGTPAASRTPRSAP